MPESRWGVMRTTGGGGTKPVPQSLMRGDAKIYGPGFIRFMDTIRCGIKRVLVHGRWRMVAEMENYWSGVLAFFRGTLDFKQASFVWTIG